MASVRFAADYAKRLAGCKKCKQPIDKGSLRLAKILPNPFTDKADEMKQYYHSNCLFETFQKARASTKVITSIDDIENWADINQTDKEIIVKLIDGVENKKSEFSEKTTTAKRAEEAGKRTKKTESSAKQEKIEAMFKPSKTSKRHDDEPLSSKNVEKPSNDEDELEETLSEGYSLEQFNQLCDRISSVSGYLQKTNIIKDFINRGSSDDDGDLYLLLKLLLPGVVKRVYNINSKQLVKLFSQIFQADSDSMLDDFNSKGDISDTVSTYFSRCKTFKARSSSQLSLKDVDLWLDKMTQYTKEDDQQRHLSKIAKKCTTRDLMSVIRLLKHDLRINAGAKHVLEAVDPNAYAAFQSSRNLQHVVEKLKHHKADGSSGEGMHVGVHLGIPCLPMLAEVCRSTSYAMKKCPNGMYAEIKYDGERVQIHKEGLKFHFFSRSLKAVQKHKIELFEKFIPQAFPKGESLIIDSEVLLIDNNTGNPLPFGTLGVHKKTAFKNANVCLFVFDCLLFQNENLMDKPLKDRKTFLQDNMKPIKNHVMMSEMTYIKHGDTKKLQDLIDHAVSQGLEGLMIKDLKSVYEPGKRHWLKIKKDYLLEGSMADSADLIVLGAYYGTGNKGGMMSVFLMGCYNEKTKKFCTVTKCGNGHDDATLDKINKEMKHSVIKISKDYEELPKWIDCNRQLVPDFVVKDPKQAPVWEITGAEFTSSDAHTANGISIRFPRVTRIRDDKDWKSATSLDELKNLFQKSKERANFKEDTSSNEPSSFQSSSPSAQIETPKKHDKRKSSTSLKQHSAGKTDLFAKSKERVNFKEDARSNEPSSLQTPEKHSKRKSSLSPEQHSSGKKVRTTSPEALFGQLTFFLAPDVPERKKLNRLISYFGGEITEDVDQATHLIGEAVKCTSSKVQATTASWVKGCIKEHKLLRLSG